MFFLKDINVFSYINTPNSKEGTISDFHRTIIVVKSIRGVDIITISRYYFQ